MTHYDYNKFTHPVPDGYVIPEYTQVRCVDSAPSRVDTFFVARYDIPVAASNEVKYYLDYDITAMDPPEEVNSVIYNVRVGRNVYPVAVYQGSDLWSAFNVHGGRTNIYTLVIESFDTAPPKEEAGGSHD